MPHTRFRTRWSCFSWKISRWESAFLPHTPHKAFTDGIRSWGVIRRFEYLKSTRGRYPSEARPKFALIITNQILRHLPIRRGFSERYAPPGISGRSCHSHMDHAPGCEFDENEHEEGSKEEIVTCKRVAGPDLCRMIARDRSPTSVPVAVVRERVSCTSGWCAYRHVCPVSVIHRECAWILWAPQSRILPRHLAFSMRWFPWLPWTCEHEPLTCASNTSEMLHDAIASLVSGWTMTRTCFHA